jgi:hypothetical protein
MADNKCNYSITITSKQLDELEKMATSLHYSTSGAMLVEFIKEQIKAYRNDVLKRDADLESIQ